MAKQPKKLKKKVTIAEYTRRREVWLSALESGKFKQATGQLHLIDEKGKHSFCCLGVACKVLADTIGFDLIRSKLDSTTKAADVYYRLKDHSGQGESANLPNVVAEYLGMYIPKHHKTDDSTSGNFKHEAIINDGFANSLIDLNDNHGFSFKQIAEFIRNNPHQIWKNGSYKPLKKKVQKAQKSA